MYYLYTYIFKNLFNFLYNPIAIRLAVIRKWKKKFFRPKLYVNLNNYIFFSKQ